MPLLSSPESSSPTSVWQSLLSLLLADPTQVLSVVSDLGQMVMTRFRREGLYEVFDLEVQLELLDPSGHEAIYRKREKVRFLQNNTIAFQDQAWGEGDIFATYKCSPGVPVDRYQEGYRHRILISLRQMKNRGDIEEFRIERRITDGFVKADGSLQTNVDHKMQKISVSIVFPSERKPFDMLLAEQHAERTTTHGIEHLRRLPNGNWFIEWSRQKPKQYESYILRWKW